MNAVRVERTHRDNFLHLNHADFAAGCGGLVEIARSLAEDQVAGFIRLPRFHYCKVSKYPALKDIITSAKRLDFLALGDGGPHPRGRIKTGDARTPCPHPFSERALGAEFDFEFASEILPLKFLILADIARHHFLDLARAEQLTEAFAVNACII